MRFLRLSLPALLLFFQPEAIGLPGQPTESWVARYNGPASCWDWPSSQAVDKEGNVYVTGESCLNYDAEYHFCFDSDYATVKYDSEGGPLWTANYNGPGNGPDRATSLAVDQAGNVFVTGYSWGDGTSIDYATVKYDPDGNELWTARYNGPGNGWHMPASLAVDETGNVFVTGYSWGDDTDSDYATVKYDPDGNELWTARYNGTANGSDGATSLAVDETGNVFVTGYSQGRGTDYDYVTVKYDSLGNTLWTAFHDGPKNGRHPAVSLNLDHEGNVFVTGESPGDGTGDDYTTVKADPDGKTLWVARYNGSRNGSDTAASLAVDPTGNVYVTGENCNLFVSIDYLFNDCLESDYATVKYDPEGNRLWAALYNGPGNGRNRATSLAVDGIGNVYVTGENCMIFDQDFSWCVDSSYATVKYDPEGNQLWMAQYNGPEKGENFAASLAVDQAGNVYVTGSSWGGATYDDYATVKYDPDGNPLWTARYNGPENGWDRPTSLVVDEAGNVFVTGSSWGGDTRNDYATVKYNPHGVPLWAVRYNGPENGSDHAASLAVDQAGNVYVTGYIWGDGTSDDYATVKYDPHANEVWTARYNGPENGWDRPTSLAVDEAGNVFVAGSSWGGATYGDYATVKYDSLGNTLWTARYNGPGNGSDHAASLALDQAGNVYVAGESRGSGSGHDYATVKYDPNGIPLWAARYDGTANGHDHAASLAVDQAGNVYVTGGSVGDGTDIDYATIKNVQLICNDHDGDGYGYPGTPLCDHPEEDCDNTVSTVHPGAAEDCFNVTDDDCDGNMDYEDFDCGQVAEDYDSLRNEFLDTDRDGLTNREEFDLWWYGYHITDKDTLIEYMERTADLDQDGIPDGLEVALGTDPMNVDTPPEGFVSVIPNWMNDDDQDGINNALEIIIYKTNPLEADTDGDGYLDGEEISLGSFATDASWIPDFEGIVVGRVVMDAFSEAGVAGVNGVEIVLSGDEDSAWKAVTGPLFGKEGSFVFGVEGRDMEPGKTFHLNISDPKYIVESPTLPLALELTPYPPALDVGTIKLEGYPDRDFDSVPDEAEEKVYATSTSNKDNNGDGILDGYDTDRDGMPDGYEILQRMNEKATHPDLFEAYCCNPLVMDDGENPDEDYQDDDPDNPYTNLEEMQGNTDPNSAGNDSACSGPISATMEISGNFVKIGMESTEGEERIQSLTTYSLIPMAVVGRVLSRLTGAGLPGATVRFYDDPSCDFEGGCKVLAEAETRENGIFWAVLIEEGDYWIRACRAGYYEGKASFHLTAGESTGFIHVALVPTDPKAVTPDTWWRDKEKEETEIRDLTGSEGGFRAWKARQVNRSQPIFVPMPVQNWGGVPAVQARQVQDESNGKQKDGSLLSGRYQLDINTKRMTGSAVSRVEQDKVSRAFVILDHRPGDAVTQGQPTEFDPDGKISVDDAQYVLGVVVQKDGCESRKNLDVVSLGPKPAEEETWFFLQDGVVGLEDALAVMQDAKKVLHPPLPLTMTSYKKAKTVRFHAASSSGIYVFDDSGAPLGSSPVEGWADLEILSFPLDPSGSAFRIKGFYGKTTEEISLPFENTLIPIKSFFEVVSDEDQTSNAVGTIVWGQRNEGVQSFQVDNFYMDLKIRGPLGFLLYTFEDITWFFYGSLRGGTDEQDPIRIHTGFLEFYGCFELPGMTFCGSANLLLILQYLPDPTFVQSEP